MAEFGRQKGIQLFEQEGDGEVVLGERTHLFDEELEPFVLVACRLGRRRTAELSM